LQELIRHSYPLFNEGKVEHKFKWVPQTNQKATNFQPKNNKKSVQTRY
jgi:hypothetical protein